jgi:expansin (peptidoglycan-binding protein)
VEKSPSLDVPHMTAHAEGAFDVKTTPLSPDDATTGTPIGRFGLDKQYHGDLDAQSKGEMLGAGNPASGTAGYVAIEHVTGSLHGRNGSFALQHIGTMDQGRFDLTVKVVPGSGSGELAGIAGTMKIIIANGKHSYEFDYTLRDT